MAEQKQSTFDSSDSHHTNKAVPAFNNGDLEQDRHIHDVGGRIANERDAGLVEAGQQPLEKSRTAKSNTSQQDPKLVYCLALFAEETNEPHR
jgi:hypothetical protein